MIVILGSYYIGSHLLFSGCHGFKKGLFSSGPLDESAHEHPIEPTHPVRKLMERAGARGHVTFGGALPEDAQGFPAKAMAKEHSGDWRHLEDAEAWGHELAAELAGDEGR